MTYGLLGVIVGETCDVCHLTAHFRLVLAYNSLRDAVSGLRMVTHQVRVNKVNTEAIQLVSAVLLTGSHQIVAEIANLTKGPQELGRREAIGVLHALLGALSGVDTDEGLEVLGNPVACLPTVFRHRFLDMGGRQLLLMVCLGRLKRVVRLHHLILAIYVFAVYMMCLL